MISNLAKVYLEKEKFDFFDIMPLRDYVFCLKHELFNAENVNFDIKILNNLKQTRVKHCKSLLTLFEHYRNFENGQVIVYSQPSSLSVKIPNALEQKLLGF